MPTEDEMATLDDRPLKIMNLTKKMSCKNNFSSEDEEEETASNVEELANTQQNELFMNEPPFQDYQQQSWPSVGNLRTTYSGHTPIAVTSQSVN